MIRFYPISFNELLKMKNKDVDKLYYAMAKLKAQEKLEEIKISCFSKLSKESREEVIEHYQNQAGLKNKDREIKVDSFADLAKFL